MQQFHKNRLLRLADKLTGEGVYRVAGPVPAHKFDMADWFSRYRGSAEVIGLDDFNPRKCKTAACAVGWAISDPWFASKGLRIGYYDSADFFGISSSDSEYLFSPTNYFNIVSPNPVTVAKRIRNFVRMNEVHEKGAVQRFIGRTVEAAKSHFYNGTGYLRRF